MKVDPRFAALKPKIDELIAPLCPQGYSVIMLVLEPDPARPREALTHMLSDIKNDVAIANVLHAVSIRLAGPEVIPPPGAVH